MKLVVGLGNPGQKYEGTRHNVGFEVLAELARRYDVGRPKSKFDAEVAEASIKNEKTVLVSPLTFMNLSGKSVRAAYDFYKLSLDDILVICDDISLPVSRLRLRPGGSSGGQNGLNDIIQRLGSREFCRLRLGVGRVPSGWDASDFVLGRFNKDDRVEIDVSVMLAADAVETWIESGIQKAMNRFNADPKAAEKAKQAKAEKAKAKKAKEAKANKDKLANENEAVEDKTDSNDKNQNTNLD